MPGNIWTAEEENYLRQNHPSKSIKEIAYELKRSSNGVSKKASRLNLKKVIWDEQSEKILLENYRNLTVKELAVKLNRSVNSVAQHLSAKGLKKSSEDLSKIMKRKVDNYVRGEKHYSWKGGTPKARCLECKNEFEGVWGNPNKFCSVKCGSTYYGRFKRGENNRFWKGGEINWKNKRYLYSSSEWIKLRKDMITESGCVICGNTKHEDLHIHHKIKYRLGGSNERDNLIVLCKNCHAQLHGLEAFYYRNNVNKSFDQLAIELKRKKAK